MTSLHSYRGGFVQATVTHKGKSWSEWFLSESEAQEWARKEEERVSREEAEANMTKEEARYEEDNDVWEDGR